ncbi:hypothetical protein ACP4OV_009308 [Aristida adscensionis]
MCRPCAAAGAVAFRMWFPRDRRALATPCQCHAAPCHGMACMPSPASPSLPPYADQAPSPAHALPSHCAGDGWMAESIGRWIA